jgi:hypothetical protein
MIKGCCVKIAKSSERSRPKDDAALGARDSAPELGEPQVRRGRISLKRTVFINCTFNV